MERGNCSRRFIGATLFALLLCVPAHSHAATFGRPLSVGSTGTDVSALQQFLKNAGFYTFPNITGYFGQVTKNAVAAFQAAHDISSIGLVGPITLNLLNTGIAASAPGIAVSAPESAPTLVLTRILDTGSTGTDVSALQQFLKNAGFYTYPTITGYFGAVTKNAVAAFQAAHGLPSVGTVGPLTRAVLVTVSSGSSSGTASTHPEFTNANGGISSGASEGSGGGGGSSQSAPPSDTTPPVVSAISSGTPGTTSATIQWTTDESADSDVAYGTTSSYGATTTPDTSLVTSHSVTITGLTVATTYHFRIRTADSSGNTAYSADQTFTTSAAPDITPPVISSIASTSSATAATITWTTNEAASSTVAYGTTTGYGTASSSSPFVTSHTITLTGLTASTVYHYQIQSADSSGNLATSTDRTVTTTATLDVTPPVLSSIVSSPTFSGATITWTTNENASSTVNYGTSSTYGTASTTATLITSHSITLSGLAASTLYHFQVASADASNNVATSSDLTFTTTAAPDVTPPTISAIASSPTASTATITWTTNENASSTVAYGASSAYGTASSSSALATSHSITLTGLIAATTYHYQVQSADASGNLATSSDQTVTTSAAPDTTPPTVALTAPAGGSTVSGTSVAVTASASDDVAVVGVQFKLDGALLSAEDTSAPYAITWNTTATSTGSHTLLAVARDAAGNLATSSPITVTVDNTAPVLSSIASSTTSTGATITWTTNENASSTVNYGTTSVYGTASTSAALVTSHTVTLTGLTAATTYHYQVASADVSNNVATSSDLTFITTSAPDTTPPIISSIATSSSSSGATITWTTNENASSTIAYGTSIAYGTASSSSTLATSHSITLTGLSAATTYHFQIQAADASGNLATSSDQTVTTSSGVVADGTVTGVSIESSGYLADITVKGLTSRGTYALTPESTPNSHSMFLRMDMIPLETPRRLVVRYLEPCHSDSHTLMELRRPKRRVAGI
ncbi:MAG: hypothetical protein JWM39_40 [Parcubacteria group bacterium]|nr:hypothetical protein [Parcubacteria group bacterium]